MNGLGFWNAACHRCKRKQVWQGRYEDRPRCGHCGFQQSPEAAKVAAASLEAMMEAARQKARIDRQAAWDARTPEQERAYEEGRAAWRPNVSILMRKSPYCGPHLAADDPLRELQRWFAWGWDDRESEERQKQ